MHNALKGNEEAGNGVTRRYVSEAYAQVAKLQEVTLAVSVASKRSSPLRQSACAGKIPNALANVDRKCLAAERPEHVTKTIPESQRQKTAAVLFQDVALFHTPWAFNVSQINPDIRLATHIWQVTPFLRYCALVIVVRPLLALHLGCCFARQSRLVQHPQTACCAHSSPLRGLWWLLDVWLQHIAWGLTD